MRTMPSKSRPPHVPMPSGDPGHDPQHLGDRLLEPCVRDVHERAHRPQRVERAVAEGEVVQRTGDPDQTTFAHQPHVGLGEIDAHDVEPLRLPRGGVESRSGADVDQVPPTFGDHELAEGLPQALSVLADLHSPPAARLGLVVGDQVGVQIHGPNVGLDPGYWPSTNSRVTQ